MFFPASKLIFFLITPSNFCIFAILVGLGLTAMTRWRRTGFGCALFGALLLAAGGL